MTKYRLKDQELQHHLDAISGGAFSECLKVDLSFFEDGVTRINFGKEFGYASQFSVLILKDEFEALPEYNPNYWNTFLDVTPPEDVLMRVETEGGRKFCGYYHSFAEGGCWCYEDGTICPEAISKSVERYRPWE